MQSELQTVNYLLDVLGSPPVTTLEILHPDIATCKAKLANSSLTLQSLGYWFNRDYGITLTPDADTKEVLIPEDVCKVISIGDNFVIQRGTKLYNTYTNSYEFDMPVTVDVIRHLEWDLLPLSAQLAIQYHAAMQVCSIDLEDSNKANEQQQLWQNAQMQVNSEETQLHPRNMLNTPHAKRVRSHYRHRGQYNPMYPGGGY